MVSRKISFAAIVAVLMSALVFMGCPHGTQTQEKTFTVTAYSDSETSKSYTVTDGDLFSSIGIPDPEKEGYTFSGWYFKDRTKVSSSYGVESDIDVYAQYVKLLNDGENGTSSSETLNADGSKEIVTVKVEEDDDGNRVTSTETVVRDSDGNFVSNTTVTSTETSEGKVTTVTETKDEDGNVLETETSEEQITASYYIQQGLKALGEIEDGVAPATAYAEAKKNFDLAYEKFPNDSAAKIYSALMDIASISTSEKIGAFFKDHLGITNYPSTMNALLDPEWLSAQEYLEEEDEDSVSVYTFTSVDEPYAEGRYYYRAKRTSGADSILVSKYNLYIKTDEVTAAELEIEETGDLYVVSADADRLAGKVVSSIKDDDIECLLDDDGEAFVYVHKPYSEMQGFTPYDYPHYVGAKDNVKFKRYVELPKFNTSFDKLADGSEWFKFAATDSYYLPMLVAANVLVGNVNGLNDAIDDIYDAVFNSSELASACEKIQGVTEPVTFSAYEVELFGLDKLFGNGAAVMGPAELKLITSAFNVLKGTFEFIQSYSFDTDLSFLKFDWSSLVSAFSPDASSGDPSSEDEENSAAAIMGLISELFGKYNAAIDPIANGFLFARSNGQEKLNASKATFVSVVNDVIDAYDSILSSQYYPDSVRNTLSAYAVLRQGAVQLISALQNNGKFYIPLGDVTAVETWPVSGEAYIDIGKLFTAGTFALDKILELGSDKKPVFYSWTYGTDGNIVSPTVLTTEKLLEIFVSQMGGSDPSAEPAAPVGVGIKQNMASLFSGDNAVIAGLLPSTVVEMDEYVNIPAQVLLFIYDFYNDGACSALLSELQNAGSGEGAGD